MQTQGPSQGHLYPPRVLHPSHTPLLCIHFAVGFARHETWQIEVAGLVHYQESDGEKWSEDEQTPLRTVPSVEPTVSTQGVHSIEVTRDPVMTRKGLLAQQSPELRVSCKQHRAMGD